MQNLWQLKEPLQAIALDCDGTLSAIEGIDELARENGVFEPVQVLTTQAMSESGINKELYRNRLALVAPTQTQVSQLSELYRLHEIAQARDVIQIFQRLAKKVYILSAGLYPAVAAFGHYLGVPIPNIYAVDIFFDTEGHYINFDENSPLVNLYGKPEILQSLPEKRILHMGDGMNDYASIDTVTRFVGFGGAYYRAQLEKITPFYIRIPSFVPLLPLSLTQTEVEQLLPEERKLYDIGVYALEKQDVTIQTQH